MPRKKVIKKVEPKVVIKKEPDVEVSELKDDVVIPKVDIEDQSKG
jgi:hypothetical protein